MSHESWAFWIKNKRIGLFQGWQKVKNSGRARTNRPWVAWAWGQTTILRIWKNLGVIGPLAPLIPTALYFQAQWNIFKATRTGIKSNSQFWTYISVFFLLKACEKHQNLKISGVCLVSDNCGILFCDNYLSFEKFFASEWTDLFP